MSIKVLLSDIHIARADPLASMSDDHSDAWRDAAKIMLSAAAKPGALRKTCGAEAARYVRPLRVDR